jgi:hypothetical protein
VLGDAGMEEGVISAGGDDLVEGGIDLEGAATGSLLRRQREQEDVLVAAAADQVTAGSEGRQQESCGSVARR